MSTRIGGFKAQEVSTPKGTPAKSPETAAEKSSSGWSTSNKARREVTGRGPALNVPQPAPEQRLLRAGQSGEDVRAMQKQLGITASGTFDAPTLRAVKDFQATHNLKVDGLVGPKTMAALAAASRPQTPQVPTRAPQIAVQQPQPQTHVTTPARLETPPEKPTVSVAASTTSHGVSDAALGDPAARLAMARQITKPLGSATQADVDAVVSEVSRMPLSELRDLQKAGINFVACRDSVADAYPYLAKEHPRGWPPGKGWTDVPGAYMPNEKSVVVATRDAPGGGRMVFPSGDKHGSASLAWHEGGHAVDAARKYPSLHDAAFQTAYQADLASAHLGAYYTQGGDAGPSEAYAESHALYLSGDPTGEGARAFPKMMDYWKNKYAAGAPS